MQPNKARTLLSLALSGGPQTPSQKWTPSLRCGPSAPLGCKMRLCYLAATEKNAVTHRLRSLHNQVVSKCSIMPSARWGKTLVRVGAHK